MMLCFVANIPKSLQKVYKCIKKDLPRAATWIFSQNEKTGDLAFENMSEKDVVVVNNVVSGLTSPSEGDSGSPYWTTSDEYFDAKTCCEPILSENKAILVAIVSAGLRRDPVVGVYDYKNQCLSMATKLTSEIVAWAKQKSGISEYIRKTQPVPNRYGRRPRN